MWYTFLDQWNGISFFIDDNIVIAADFDLYTDASSTIGFGGYFRNKWVQGKWPKLVIDESFSMAYLELYPIVIASVLWGSDWAGKRILFHCDNSSTVCIIKKGRSKSREIMSLIRRLTMCSAKYNFVVHAVHLPGKYNNIGDALSRYQMKGFREHAPQALPKHCPFPSPLRNCVELNKIIDDLFFGCINSSTKSAYISGFKCVIRFLQSYSGSFGEYKYSNISGDNIRTVISALTEDVLIYFIAYCQSRLGLTCSTIKLYLAGVRHFGITYANRNPLVDQYGNQLLRLHNVLQSVKTSSITYVLLAKMFNY
jgi:hypothetical protein